MSESKLKRYIIYKGTRYYPYQAMGDFYATTDDREEALSKGRSCLDPESDYLHWSRVFDTHDFKYILECDVEDKGFKEEVPNDDCWEHKELLEKLSN